MATLGYTNRTDLDSNRNIRANHFVILPPVLDAMNIFAVHFSTLNIHIWRTIPPMPLNYLPVEQASIYGIAINVRTEPTKYTSESFAEISKRILFYVSQPASQNTIEPIEDGV